VSDQRPLGRAVTVLSAGLVIGLVEVILAVAFATLVLGGYLVLFWPNGIGLCLLGAAITMGVLAWRAGKRGVVGSVQDAAAAVLALISYRIAVATFANPLQVPGAVVKGTPREAFVTTVAAVLVVTTLCGIAFLALGTFKLGNLVRFIPYPVVGGFLAGTGWLLLKGGVGVAAGTQVTFRHIWTHPRFPDLLWRLNDWHSRQLTGNFLLSRWVPALVFGALLLVATRVSKRPILIPALGIALLLCVLGMLVTHSSIEDARRGLWLIGPFESTRLLEPWTLRALTSADWALVAGQAGNIATAVFVAVIATLINVTGLEVMMHTDLDTNQELRDAGLANVVSGPFGGIPGYHAVSLTSLVRQMNVGTREAGLVAALVPLAAALFGGSLVQLIPRFLVAGTLVFVGMAFIVEWLVDQRRNLPIAEYAIVLVIFGTIAFRDYLTGVEVGLVASAVLFAFNYSGVRLVHQVEFGTTYRSNVDRPQAERRALRELADRVLILRVNGFVFFGVASGLVERIHRRVEAAPPRFLLVDLQRVTGIDTSVVMALRKVALLAKAYGVELVFSGASEALRAKLHQGGVLPSEGVVSFEPDLDRGLQRVEEGLLQALVPPLSPDGAGDPLSGLPERLGAYLERQSIPEGTVLLRQAEPSDDLFVLESGRLKVETTTPEGTRMRLRSVRSGVIVGEIAMYLRGPRTADVVAETPCVVLRLSRAALERMEAEDPRLAAELHRRLAVTLSARVSDSLRVFDELRD
jgi:SulP family sulfate permease